jgi:hypothetical protein
MLLWRLAGEDGGYCWVCSFVSLLFAVFFADPAVGSQLGVGLFLWASLEEGGLLLAGEEAGRRRLAPVEAVAAEESPKNSDDELISVLVAIGDA